MDTTSSRELVNTATIRSTKARSSLKPLEIKNVKTWLVTLLWEDIIGPDTEPSLSTGGTRFEWFLDDAQGATEMFEDTGTFPRGRYFPRLRGLI